MSKPEKLIAPPHRAVAHYDFDDFRLDPRRRELLKSGTPLPLTHKAFQTLLILVQNFGQTVEKEDIYHELWGDSFVEDANLTQYIYLLRKTLGQRPTGEQYIETIARTGYRFNADVSAVYPKDVVPMSSRNGSADTAIPPLRLAPRAEEAPPEEVTATAEAPVRKIRLLYPAIAVGVLVAIGLVFWIYKQKFASPAPEKIKSVAVLPLKPIGDDDARQKMGFGMADAIISRLAKLRRVPVRPTSAIFRFTDEPPASSIDAGRELGVDTVLEGTVQRAGDRVRVSVQLVDVADGRPLWAENFDENYTNVFNVQDSISTKIADALEVNLNAGEKALLARHNTTSPEAFQAYQMGVYLYNKRSRENLEQAVTYLQKAVDIDPNYAPAYAILADTHNMQSYYGYAGIDVADPQARAAAEKALQLNDSLAEAYVAMAFLRMDAPEPRAQRKALLEKAIDLSPYLANARVRYAWVLLQESVDAAVEQMRLAQQYDPLSAVTNGALCNVLIFQKNYEEAIGFCEKSVQIDAGLPVSRELLAMDYYALGRHDDAIRQIKKRIDETEGSEKWSATGSLAFYLAKAGRTTEAEKLLSKIKEAQKEYPDLLTDLTLISYAMGRPDEGFEYFKKAFELPSFGGGMFRFAPTWEDARQDPRVMEHINERRRAARLTPLR